VRWSRWCAVLFVGGQALVVGGLSSGNEGLGVFFVSLSDCICHYRHVCVSAP
jgi:hypothetical protein